MKPNEISDDQMADDEILLHNINEQAESLKQCLEKAKFMGSNVEMVKYQNFWCRETTLNQILHYQSHFKAQDSDIILASLPKSGTTWLKSLLFTIVNRFNSDHQPLTQKSPLLSHNPHELVYYLENGVYGGYFPQFPTPQQLQHLPSPRLLSTHLPYPSFPDSITNNTTSCKIVYIARNPFDTLVSQWHWYVKLMNNLGGDNPEFEPPSVEDFFDEFCLGKIPLGPYFDHVLEFWKQSVEQPNKVLFLKYEDLKGVSAVFHLKKLAEFVGFPFSDQEESDGIIGDVMELCSINTLKELEVNKSGSMHWLLQNKNYFRKGQVGDWTNYFTPFMVEKLDCLIQQHFEGTGLSFQMH